MEVPIMQSDKPKKGKEKLGVHKPVEEVVKEFVGEVENIHTIDVNSLFDDNYRVNVWTKYLNEGGLSYRYEIKYSYFMQYRNGKLTDLTRQPKEKHRNPFAR